MTTDLGIHFADISGTTRLYRKIGTSEGQYQLERCVKRMERAIATNHGRLLMPAADELIAAFPKAEDAILCATEMQRRIEDLPPLSGLRLSIRIGVHFGQIIENESGLSGSAVDIGRELLNLAGSGQVITCAKTAALLGLSLRQQLYSLEGMSLLTEQGDVQVYQVNWRVAPIVVGDSPALAPPLPFFTPPSVKLPKRIALRLGDKAYLVDERSPKITLGRDKESTVVLKGLKVSRQHAQLIYRAPGQFILIDSSTNGSYVHPEGTDEVRVHGEEFVLSGHGKLAFGHPTGLVDDEVFDYEIV